MWSFPNFSLLCVGFLWGRNKWIFEYVKIALSRKVSFSSLRVGHAVKCRKSKEIQIHINVDNVVSCSSAFRGLGSMRRSSDGFVLMALATPLIGHFFIEASEGV